MKAYLGDSVYVERDGRGVVLTTENGYGPTNTILLEAEVLDALLGFVARIVEDGDAAARIERLRGVAATGEREPWTCPNCQRPHDPAPSPCCPCGWPTPIPVPSAPLPPSAAWGATCPACGQTVAPEHAAELRALASPAGGASAAARPGPRAEAAVLIRLTAEEHARLRGAATRAGLGVSAWLRSLGLREAAR
jgi:hypothetical protein